MTLLTHQGEAGPSMVDRHRGIILFHMALNACARSADENEIGVTRPTGRTAVLTVERKRSLLMVEDHRCFQRRPAFRRMAIRTLLLQLTVG